MKQSVNDKILEPIVTSAYFGFFAFWIVRCFPTRWDFAANRYNEHIVWGRFGMEACGIAFLCVFIYVIITVFEEAHKKYN